MSPRLEILVENLCIKSVEIQNISAIDQRGKHSVCIVYSVVFVKKHICRFNKLLQGKFARITSIRKFMRSQGC